MRSGAAPALSAAAFRAAAAVAAAGALLRAQAHFGCAFKGAQTDDCDPGTGWARHGAGRGAAGRGAAVLRFILAPTSLTIRPDAMGQRAKHNEQHCTALNRSSRWEGGVAPGRSRSTSRHPGLALCRPARSEQGAGGQQRVSHGLVCVLKHNPQGPPAPKQACTAQHSTAHRSAAHHIAHSTSQRGRSRGRQASGMQVVSSLP